MNTQEAIARRKTMKVLSDQPWELSDDSHVKGLVQQVLQAANAAPFHYMVHNAHVSDDEEQAIVPWRFHILYTDTCRKLASYIKEEGIKAGKILQMLHTADALLLATWLPDPASDEHEGLFEANQRNMEHIAAASSAIQNALLVATARNVPNYWSSGGVLRKEDFYEVLKIDTAEIMLGALFLFPESSEEKVGVDGKIALGGLREKKGPVSGWAKEIKL